MKRKLLAIFYTLKSFKFDLLGKHIKTFSDSTTAAAVINKMGNCKNNTSNKRAQQIWGFCQQFHIWITVSRIQGKKNFEWMLKHRRFCHFSSRQIVLQLEQTLSFLNTFQGDQTQKPNLQMLLQLIGIPICTIFSFPLACYDVFSKRFK